MTTKQHQPPFDEDFSVETPQDFPPFHPSGRSAPPQPPDLEEEYEGNPSSSDEFVSHGRSRRWYLTAGAIVIVLVAVGGGVGAALSKKGGTKQVASAQSTAVAGAGGSSAGGTSSNNDGYGISGGASSSSGGSTSGNDAPVHTAGTSSSNNNKKNNGQGTTAGSTGTTAEGSPEPTMSPTSEVFDIILTHSRYKGLEFTDPNSYQSKAAKWVEDTAQLGVQTPERLVQRYALACLYYSTNAVKTEWTDELFGVDVIRGWIDETGWLNYDDECSWYKVTCNGNGKVTKIQLSQNRLTGSLPPELVLLNDSLEEIDLYDNPIYNSGDAGNHWLGELTNIKRLYYGRTYFEYDGIPSVIGQLANLVEYDCSYSLYHGLLRGEAFQNKQNLVYLYIGGNIYRSTIPSQITDLPKLQYLYVEYSDLTGDLSFLVNMPQIEELWIDRNPKMHGSIPSEIGLVTSLRSFSVTDCGLTGTLPTELAELRMKQFWCYSNDLTGTVPTQYGSIQSLTYLGVENNTLTGTMPQGICANRVTDGGLLSKLEADCQDGGSLQCDCCTCCGPACLSDTNANASSRRFVL